MNKISITASIVFSFSVIVAAVLFSHSSILSAATGPITATTTVTISVCGDAIPTGSEVCDDGTNTGGYSTTSPGNCLPGCVGFDAYCGDSILHPLFGETCDDGNNSSGDSCSATCIQESTPGGNNGSTNPAGGPPIRGGSGGSIGGNILIFNPTNVRVEGSAYPNAPIHILKDGEEIALIEADADALFEHDLTNLTPGPTTFGFWAEDNQGRNSITYNTTFQVTEGAVTSITGVLIPPTISVSEPAVKPGDELIVSGQTIPNAVVVTQIDADDSLQSEATSTPEGDWEHLIDTSQFAPEEFHTIKALFRGVGTELVTESGFSQSISFFVGFSDLSDVITADINKDGNVDLIDFSILLFNWGTDTITADLNQDGTVNLTDFSILLFNWTG